MRKYSFLLCVLAVVLISCGASFEIKIPKKIIMSQVEKKFPTVKNKGLMSIEISDPKLNFDGAANRILVDAQAAIRFLGIVPVKGSLTADGTLEYHPENGTFVFSDVKIHKFNIKDIPQSQLDEVNGLLTSGILSALGGLEVYKLDPTDTKENLAKMALRSIRIANDGVIVRLGVGR